MAEPTPTRLVRTVLILVVDRHGNLLLQERDEFAPLAPHRWALPGGAIAAGEHPAAAAERELFEETGLRPGPLALFWHGRRRFEGPPGMVTEWYVYYARTWARQDDVIVGEGRAMVFTPPAAAAGLPLTMNAWCFLDSFVHSAEYTQLLARPGA